MASRVSWSSKARPLMFSRMASQLSPKMFCMRAKFDGAPTSMAFEMVAMDLTGWYSPSAR